MCKFISVFVIILFFVWILPLGVFIKPEKEEMACNGQRAICLCTQLIIKHFAKQGVVTFWKNCEGVNKAKSYSPYSSLDFLAAAAENTINHEAQSFVHNSPLIYNRLFVLPIEHVPKV